jgi:beta-galactosidase
VLSKHHQLRYLAGWPDDALMLRILGDLAKEAGITATLLPEGVRLRRSGGHLFAVNYGEEAFDLRSLGLKGEPVLGGFLLAPSGVTILRGG